MAFGSVIIPGAPEANSDGVAKLLYEHTGDRSNPHGVTARQIGAAPESHTHSAEEIGARPNTWTPTASDVGAIPIAARGAANGVAALDDNGKIPENQLPRNPVRIGEAVIVYDPSSRILTIGANTAATPA